MNRKLMVLAVAGALSAPGLALAQASSVQIYGTITYGPEIRSAGGGDASAIPAAGGSSVRGGGLGGAYIAAGGLVPNVSSRTATTGSGSNWGLRGREDLGRGMYAGFQIETSIQGDALSAVSATASGTFASYRNTGVWLGTPIGEFGTGMWDTPYATLMNTSGVHGQVYGNSSTSASAAIYGGLPFAATTYSGQPIMQTCAPAGIGTTAKGCFASVTTFSRRQGTSIWYQSPNWSGFRARLQYKVNHGDSTTDTSSTVANNVTTPNALETSIWGVSGTYTNGPLFVGVGYERHNDLAAFGIKTFGPAGAMILGANGGGTIAQFSAPNLTGSDAHAWNINARYTFPMGFSAGLYYERLNWDFSYGNANAFVAGVTGPGGVPLASNVTNLDKTAWRLDGAYQTGPHTIGLMYNRANDIGGATIGAGFNGNDTGTQSWQLGYAYSFSKRTSAFAYYTQVTNDTNASSAGIVFNGLTPAVGGDPKYYGMGLRHTF